MNTKQEYKSDIIYYDDHEVMLIYDQFGNIVNKDIRYYNPDDVNLNRSTNESVRRR